MSRDKSMTRRGFLVGATGATAGAAASAPVAAQDDEHGDGGETDSEDGGGGSGDEEPDFGGWLDGVDGGFEDVRGQDEVTVEVGAEGNDGAFAFSPAGLWVDPGTTVHWEWTGEGGSHNVHAVEGGDFESDLYQEAGEHFEHAFEEGGITNYQCDPHADLGMKGAVAVGDEVPTVSTGGDGGGEGGLGPFVPDSAKTLGVATFMAMLGTLGLTFFLMKYGGDRTPEP